MRKALDVANYSTIPTPEQVACLVAQGYDTAIVGCSYGSVAHGQLAAFSAGGMGIEAYAWVSFGPNWQRPLDKALSVIDGLSITRLWLDCEEQPGAGYDQAAVIQRVNDAIAYTQTQRGDLELGIYTAGWWYGPNCGTYDGWKDMPLWYAHYDGVPTFDDWDSIAFGGWQVVE